MTDERLGPDARALIARALREEAQADASELARIRKRVLTVSVGVGALGSAGKTLAVSGLSGGVGALSIAKAALLGASAAIVAVGLSSALKPQESQKTEEPPPLSAPTPMARVTAVEQAATGEPGARPAQPARKSLPAASHAKQAPPTSAPRATSGREREQKSPGLSQRDVPSTGSDSSLLEEIALLERVQTALRAGNGASALTLLDQSSPGPGSGQLGSERLAAEVFAACQLGDRERASRAARRFLKIYGAAPASARVRTSCAGGETGR